MKIAYFTDTYNPEVNGVTNTLSRLGSYLDGKCIRHTVFAPAYEYEDTLPPRENLHSVCCNLYRFKGVRAPFSPKSRLAFPAFKEIDEICGDFRPDLVHVTTELGIGFRGVRYALTRNLPLVMSYHTDYGKYLRYFKLEFFKPLLEKYLAWFYRFAHRVLAPSRHTLEDLFRRQYRNLGLWSRGIDTALFNPRYRNRNLRNRIGKDKFIFLYAGRLSPEKNLDMLLHAAAEMECRFPRQTVFVFAGDGPYARTIRKQKLSNVVLAGFKRGRELSEIYASADCFAFPSGTETFGNAALEAMASGLPVAGVANGGVTDFLSHGNNALLCPEGGREAFLENLVTLMKNPGLRLSLAEGARKTALTRDWNCVFDGLMDTYAAVIEEQRQRGWKQAS
ncbi:MAG: glycosyltransferase family 1 protein [Spirochaetaceae bacterium]|jgi:glycosyltransferase involved in cell wall biosynthesis|nr:glycosyltransferase family 1 protein [Spirochaetaceae bacterium]